MSSERERRALGEPPTDLSGLPTKTLEEDWFRAHTAGHGPWWFSPDGQGRFDLPAPDGTCYLASHCAAAVHERLGETLARAKVLTGAEADRMVVSRLPLAVRVADTTVQRATGVGVTRELSTITPYDLPRRWAAALHNSGHAGLRYWPRFSLSPSYRAVALFGEAGADATRPTDPTPIDGPTAAKHAGIVILDPPRKLRIIHPPP